MSEDSGNQIICPACATPGSGRFCASCGASLGSSGCSGCGASLAAGAKFCHKCGQPAGTSRRQAAPARTSQLRWIVAGAAIIALVALTAWNTARRNGVPGNAAVSLSPASPEGSGAMSPEAPVRGPDISQLSPQERADRLYNRVMLLAGQGKTDSVMFFAPMAINAYQMLSPLNADQRYDIGRIAEVAGALPLAQAQADSILATSPTHLLGLVLGARVASLRDDAAAKKSYGQRILAANAAESARKLPEYERHSADISAALDDARR